MPLSKTPIGELGEGITQTLQSRGEMEEEVEIARQYAPRQVLALHLGIWWRNAFNPARHGWGEWAGCTQDRTGR